MMLLRRTAGSAIADIMPWCIKCRAVVDVWVMDHEVRSLPWPLLTASAREFPVNYLEHHGEAWSEQASWLAGTEHWPDGFARELPGWPG